MCQNDLHTTAPTKGERIHDSTLSFPLHRARDPARAYCGQWAAARFADPTSRFGRTCVMNELDSLVIDDPRETGAARLGARRHSAPYPGRHAFEIISERCYRVRARFRVAPRHLSRHLRSPCKTSPPAPSPATC